MKKIWIIIISVVLILAILFIPIPGEPYDDGGTREWTALTYKFVDWNRMFYDGIYVENEIFFGEDRLKTIDQLWYQYHENRDFRDKDYTEQWLDKEKLEKSDEVLSNDLVITDIYANCFFANHVTPMPGLFKINGQLPEDWCVGDQVLVKYNGVYNNTENYRIECDLISIEKSTFEIDPLVCYKPVIYLYPEKEEDISVKLELDGELTCTYPKYDKGWFVTASPNGTLTDKKGQTYNYLYWEGETEAKWDFTKGFCIKGEDTAEFLEKALSQLGLNRKEANEFIVYWLPLMQDNPYNIISFQSDIYTQSAKLSITPNPDNLIRVFMAYKPSDEFIKISPQEFSAPNRTGFTAVEWGGTEIK